MAILGPFGRRRTCFEPAPEPASEPTPTACPSFKSPHTPTACPSFKSPQPSIGGLVRQRHPMAAWNRSSPRRWPSGCSPTAPSPSASACNDPAKIGSAGKIHARKPSGIAIIGCPRNPNGIWLGPMKPIRCFARRWGCFLQPHFMPIPPPMDQICSRACPSIGSQMFYSCGGMLLESSVWWLDRCAFRRLGISGRKSVKRSMPSTPECPPSTKPWAPEFVHSSTDCLRDKPSSATIGDWPPTANAMPTRTAPFPA